jgi:hypothetical protein
MSNELLSQQDLSNWCGYKRRAELIDWLEKRSIRYEIGKDGKICTTMAWITKNNDDGVLRFDETA